MPHIKPTKEELLKGEQEAIAEAEKLEKQPQIEEEEPTEIPEEKPKDEIEPSEEVDEPEEEEEEAEEEQAEPSEEEKAEIQKKLDAEKKKSSASARENQKILAKNRVITKAIIDADEVVEPTDEEMAKMPEFKDWDIMSDYERMLAKETVISKRFRQTISKAKEQATKIEKWNESVDTFVDNPQTLIDNPELEGKVEDFRKFAQTEENNSVPMKILVSAFLHESSKGRTPNKGKMFEKGAGGENVKAKVKSKKMPLEESRKLRESNYDEWRQKVKAGEIEDEF